MLVSDEYKQTLQDTHAKEKGKWGSTAIRRVKELVGFARDWEPETVLDYGSANGKLGAKVMGEDLLPTVQVWVDYDPGYEETANNNVPSDFVYCIDVLEHIEPDCIDHVLQDIHRCMKKAGVFDIAMFQASQILTDGRNAHLIVEDESWWREKVEQYFNITGLQVLRRGPVLRLLVTPRSKITWEVMQ